MNYGRACASIKESIPERCIRSRQSSRSRFRVMAFIAVSGFSISQQPQRKSCFMAQSRAVLPPILSVIADISASCRISVSICNSVVFRTARMWWIPGGYRETMLPARTHDREGMLFGRMRGRAVVLIIAELFTGRLRWGSPCPAGRRQVSPMG